MKILSRHSLFLVLYSCCYIANAGTDDNISYLVGNDYGADPGNQKWRETSPSADITVKFRYLTSTNNLAFHKPTQLGPAGVSLYWSQLNSASDGGYPYCNRSNTVSGEPTAIENQMVDSGKRYGGHKLFETSVLGPYYILKISDIRSSYTTTNISSSGMRTGDSPTRYFRWIPGSEATLYWSCNNANSSNKHQAVDGVWQSLTVEFRTDTSLGPTKANKVTLSKPGGYLYSFKGYDLGGSINGHSYLLKIDFDPGNMILPNPTCLTTTLIGPLVNGSTVKMGDYSPAQIKNGVTAVPFNIMLQDCTRAYNIETKSKLSKVGSASKEPLASTLTGNDATGGVGVLIGGLKSIKSVQMVLKPNDSTSVYKDCEAEDDTTGGIYPDKGNGIS